MLQLLNRFVDLCLLRCGPQHLPRSIGLMLFSVFAYVIVGRIYSAFFVTAQYSPLRPVFSLLVLVGVPYALVAARGFPERFVQTLTALAGTGCLLSLAILPMVGAIPGENVALSGIQEIVYVAFLALYFWAFVVEGSIYRHALNIPLPLGIALSVLLTIAFMFVDSMLFPNLQAS